MGLCDDSSINLQQLLREKVRAEVPISSAPEIG
jgi:hypothetical protein